MRSEELFLALNEVIDFDFRINPFWWPDYGTFWVIIGAVLTQNTKWENVENSLNNLRNHGIKNLDDVLNLDEINLANMIKPSGFYNVKAKRLIELSNAILSKFVSFEEFSQNVTRRWLVSQKGIGLESTDGILCYACKRDIMVVDRYALRILGFLGYEFEKYDEAKEWLENINKDKIDKNMQDNELFAKYHGLIVEFCKAHFKKGNFDNFAIQILKKLN